MTSAVRDGLTLLDKPTTKIFVMAHQPNLSAYSGVFKKIVLLQTLKNLTERQDGHSKKSSQFIRYC